MLKRCTLVAAAAGALLFGSIAHAQYKDEYTVSTVLPSAFPWGQAADKWVELVNERSEGRINMKIYSNSQLVSGDQTKEFSAMRSGLIDMAVGSTINWSPQVPELNLFSLPFLMPDYPAIDAITQGEVGEAVFAAIQKRGVTPLAWGENGFRELSNSKRAIREPADVEGLKVRVVGSPLFQDTFNALGANPTQMSWADAKPALTTGAVDGQENPLSVFDVARIDQVGQEHLTLWHYMADPLVFAVNNRVWATFSADDQALLKKAAIDAGQWEIEKSRSELDATLAAIKERGVTVTELTPAQRDAFINATQSVYQEWSPRIGEDLVKKAQQAVAERQQ
ncbi:DctP family TRAP transporter solute-binding subunit [Marinobacter sp. M3C]|jgi:tripartite ATP-independent transporter DctP family solute receptor|uniref:DctP family TRAP transporter solute-binding subunit n=1 Tax=unclassified Marinobacter TaxID=83889 RepID=UPI00200D6F23|nr:MULTISPECIES: DctP family TRAP transporter solute-binding subunit [unclassified Marinobacter]MCL1479319.1 DctP family TRAP transporter solute-binding subunit [Marinobacter sp.]MCL1480834.1 DctP family TRAP transporter solute-binding subunit [Marinobacter sp.]MCL1486404.1 DctP family TRAP transporter solute-binding subunit [Marinobacter sp.]UQG55844.1 DctP family TRAP transporter solute-binding subunit [Marinobacter sp. M4C]UQG58495.1 DctP family TRAP transporter solute-binding subunit [Mari